MIVAKANEGFPGLKNIKKLIAEAFARNAVLKIASKYTFDCLSYFFQMAIEVNLLEATGHRIIDGVQANISVRQGAQCVNEFSFAAVDRTKTRINNNEKCIQSKKSSNLPVSWAA